MRIVSATPPTPCFNDDKNARYSHIHGENFDGRYQILTRLEYGRGWENYRVFDQITMSVYQLRRVSPRTVTDIRLVTKLANAAFKCLILTHRHIVTTYAVLRSPEEVLYTVNEDVAGCTLEKKLQQMGEFEPRTALDILIQIAEALQYAHGNGISHGHLSPSNIWLIDTVARLDKVQIANFQIDEIASTGVSTASLCVLNSGSLCARVAYMSPEQCRGQESTDRCDLYSFGCLLFELLTGEPPYKEANPVRTLLRHLHDCPDLSSIQQISPDLAQIVRRCLAKEPEHRYPSAKDLLCDLKRVYHGNLLSMFSL
jgi:eukaryotic-like serine/threonine-protein kinase